VVLLRLAVLCLRLTVRILSHHTVLSVQHMVSASKPFRLNQNPSGFELALQVSTR